jgi:perosamine synthetase
MKGKISWWRTSFGEEEIQRISESIRNECISQGKVTARFEQKLSEFLEVEYVVAVSSGSTALLLALMTMGVKPGDEVIVPNRTWISTAHAVHLLGAKVILVDVEADRPIIDAKQIEKQITNKTKGIIPVHMNGRSADMNNIRDIAKRNSLFVIEDAAQAISSSNADGYLGTQSDIGCFSFSMAKTISTGQGGIAVTNNSDLATRMRAIRTHGVENVKDPENWIMPGFNFRITDIQASIGIEQLKRLPGRVSHLRDLYLAYEKGLQSSDFKIIPVDLESGEIPVYNEFLVEGRSQWIKQLGQIGIETRPFYPDMDKAYYLTKKDQNFPNSKKYGLNGIYLPSGPAQQLDNVLSCVDSILGRVR